MDAFSGFYRKKVALVTGASSGIGAELAWQFVDSNIRRVTNDGNFHPAAKDAVPSWLVMSTDKAVEQILRAVARGKPEAIITNHGKLAVAIERFAPWLIRAAGRRMNAASRNHPSGV